MATVNTIAAATVDFKAYKGDTFQVTLTFTNADNQPIDLSQASIKMQIRKSPQCDPDFTLDETDGIAVGGANNNEVSISKLIDLNAGIYKYDFQVTLSGVVTTYIKGNFKVVQDITE